MPVDWARTVFVLVMPDGILRHLAGRIVERIINAEFAPVAYKIIPTRPTNLDEFYEKNIRTAWDAYRFRLIDLLLELGPTLAILFEDRQSSSGSDGYARIQSLKGSGEPTLAVPGTIRHDFRAINVVMNMMHASDSAEDAMYEAEVFLAPDGLKSILPVTSPNHAELHGAIHLLTASRRREVREFEHVLGEFRASILAAMWGHLHSETRERTASLLLEGGIRSLARRGVGHELAATVKEAESHPLHAALTCEFEPGAPAIDMRRTQHLLSVFGLRLDPWQELVLSSSLVFQAART